MKIALDAMGGDYAPGEIIKGAVEAVQKEDIEIILVGNKELLAKELINYRTVKNLSIYHAGEVIEMDEEPAAAVRKKKDSSIVVATSLVKKQMADAVVSAGSTGAQMASALLGLGRIKGIHRPAIATFFPTLKGATLLLDVGANTACKPLNLVQYAEMGHIYMQKIAGITNPKIGLLNIGLEETKGNELSKEAYQLLRQSGLNFVGNIEARYITSGEADVIVCDGFVGNVVLKFAEGLATSLFSLLKTELSSSLSRKIGGVLARPAFRAVKKKLDYDEYGGAPLLGVNGVSVICHGSSKAKAIKNAIFAAKKCVENNFVQNITEVISQESGKENKDV
ncbi:MAG: phosphate acyltransferase PlsX [Zhaonellaceae bacterium]